MDMFDKSKALKVLEILWKRMKDLFLIVTSAASLDLDLQAGLRMGYKQFSKILPKSILRECIKISLRFSGEEFFSVRFY